MEIKVWPLSILLIWSEYIWINLRKNVGKLKCLTKILTRMFHPGLVWFFNCSPIRNFKRWLYNIEPLSDGFFLFTPYQKKESSDGEKNLFNVFFYYNAPLRFYLFLGIVFKLKRDSSDLLRSNGTRFARSDEMDQSVPVVFFKEAPVIQEKIKKTILLHWHFQNEFFIILIMIAFLFDSPNSCSGLSLTDLNVAYILCFPTKRKSWSFWPPNGS